MKARQWRDRGVSQGVSLAYLARHPSETLNPMNEQELSQSVSVSRPYSARQRDTETKNARKARHLTRQSRDRLESLRILADEFGRLRGWVRAKTRGSTPFRPIA